MYSASDISPVMMCQLVLSFSARDQHETKSNHLTAEDVFWFKITNNLRSSFVVRVQNMAREALSKDTLRILPAA